MNAPCKLGVLDGSGKILNNGRSEFDFPQSDFLELESLAYQFAAKSGLKVVLRGTNAILIYHPDGRKAVVSVDAYEFTVHPDNN